MWNVIDQSGAGAQKCQHNPASNENSIEIEIIIKYNNVEKIKV